MQKRYLILPVFVTSRNDGESHFISAARLMSLYGVSPGECVIAVTAGDRLRAPGGLIRLFPRFD